MGSAPNVSAPSVPRAERPMIRSLRVPLSFALLLGLSGCVTFRPVPSTVASVGQVVRLRSATPIVLTIPAEGGATRECRVPNVRGLLFDQMNGELRLSDFRVEDAPADTPRECLRGPLADLRLPQGDGMRLEERRFSLKRTLGLGFGMYLGAGALFIVLYGISAATS